MSRHLIPIGNCCVRRINACELCPDGFTETFNVTLSSFADGSCGAACGSINGTYPVTYIGEDLCSGFVGDGPVWASDEDVFSALGGACGGAFANRRIFIVFQQPNEFSEYCNAIAWIGGECGSGEDSSMFQFFVNNPYPFEAECDEPYDLTGGFVLSSVTHCAGSGGGAVITLFT